LKSLGSASSDWKEKKATWPAVEHELCYWTIISQTELTVRKDDVKYWSHALDQRDVWADGEDVAHVGFLDADCDHGNCYGDDYGEAGWRDQYHIQRFECNGLTEDREIADVLNVLGSPRTRHKHKPITFHQMVQSAWFVIAFMAIEKLSTCAPMMKIKMST
jgi:hypothetical protein